jgi:hypothetical protein
MPERTEIKKITKIEIRARKMPERTEIKTIKTIKTTKI